MYSKAFEYMDESGAKQTLVLKPVSPMRLQEIFRIAKKFKDVKEEEIMERFDNDVIQDCVTLCVETLDRSCPLWTKEAKENFITTHFSSLIFTIFDLNTPKK